ncbi:AvrE-family type 3 secretion system effector, partial [Pseudomonas syringae pv. tagetis]|uniref:AvrE-family type 3 secretion system effector n=1 Tax=Pseudomonas syringae group genomosp. 7 TaxID=251699 RepID=UPI0037700AC9
VHARITRSNKTWRIPKNGLTARLDINVKGRGGMEKTHTASTSELIRANVYKNNAEPPRWMVTLIHI